MLFNSLTFVIFFALVLVLYYSIQSWTLRKLILLISSYVFYAAWNPPFIALLWLSTLVDWTAARAIHKGDNSVFRHAWLAVSLTVNLGLLAFYKYAGFAIDSFTSLLETAGIHYAPAAPNIILPMGISFYTFQTLSYTIDVYRKKDEPAKSFLDYALYVTFFPQLVAGPIVRSTEFLPQCLQDKPWKSQAFGYGLALMILGLFQKIVIADGLMAPIVEQVYDRMQNPGILAVWAGTMAFASQIFCDFAGYSTCAIGAALCLGFQLPRNFRAPYGAIGFSDFWQRWHITLSTWLRDYLYIPLGGNRQGQARTYVNLMLTMLIGGLWHGAAWTFVIWGGLHGLYLILERVLRAAFGHFRLWSTSIGQAIIIASTFFAVCIAWVFFRARSAQQAFNYIESMLGFQTSGEAIDKKSLLLAFAITFSLVTVHALTRTLQIQDRINDMPAVLVALGLGIMMYLCLTMPGEDRAFIYFQF